MNLSNQVTSLEVSRRLKELGVKQESYFYHCYHKGFKLYEIYRPHEAAPSEVLCSAYTVAELGIMLPETVEVEEHSYFYVQYFNRIVSYLSAIGIGEFEEIKAAFQPINHSGSEADARGKLLIYLLENNLVSIEEINNKL